MSTNFPYQQTKALMLEWLKDHQAGDFERLFRGTTWLAVKKGLYSPTGQRMTTAFEPLPTERYVHPREEQAVKELVRQLMWDFLLDRVIVFGMNEHNPDFPWYTLTGLGEQIVTGQGPQPYDPDGFMTQFRGTNPQADPVIVEYLDEAIRCFNHGCDRAAAVMLGAASEKAILLLFDAFAGAIQDDKKRKRFIGDGGKLISRKFETLQKKLALITSGDKLSLELVEVRDTLNGFFVPLFHLVRTYRNQAGHPDIPGDVSKDTVFVNLRVFPEYVRRVYELIDYFKTNPATW